jgi:hypothetical protein
MLKKKDIADAREKYNAVVASAMRKRGLSCDER